MAHSINSEVTRGQALALHAGLNTKVVQFTLDETASGSQTFAVMALPGGARMVKAQVRANHAALNAGANAGAVRLYPTIGGTSVGDVIHTSTLSYQIESGLGGFNESGLGVRLTSSANLVLQLHDLAGTGTASTVFTVIAQYISVDDPD